jgi:hypothetical protein
MCVWENSEKWREKPKQRGAASDNGKEYAGSRSIPIPQRPYNTIDMTTGSAVALPRVIKPTKAGTEHRKTGKTKKIIGSNG